MNPDKMSKVFYKWIEDAGTSLTSRCISEPVLWNVTCNSGRAA
jgi:hypothetical protein